MIKRAAISRHTGHPEKADHFDFFIEDNDSLITFSLDRDVSLNLVEDLYVTRLENHRPRYLDYEGEISGGRGHVTIIHRGFLFAADASANRVCGSLLLNGIMYTVEFTQRNGTAWHMICKPPRREIEAGKCKCLFLDLDGTIADTIPDIVDSLNETLEEFGLAKRAKSDIVVNVGWGASKLVDAFVRDPDREKALARFIELYARNAVRKTSLYPGVRETLAKLNCYKIVLTNKPESVTLNVLDSLGLFNQLDAIISPETYGVRKPDAQTILLPLGYFQVRPEDSMLVGDSDVDFETARNAGTGFCSASYGYGPFERRSEYNIVINEFGDILEVV